jgi:indolepyruvate ferredoxin oxidoreductase beta subunit
MSESIQQQVIISGVGGQGVLFVTRLLAEAAINKGLPVFTSETHGMAQRGGTVLSHFKVGDFSSPLIRPQQADILVLLKAENLKQHGNFLKTGGWAVSNAAEDLDAELVKTIDADTLAQDIENPKAVNLIVLGFALATAEKAAADGKLFCSTEDIKDVLKNRFGKNESMLNASLKALEAGYKA